MYQTYQTYQSRFYEKVTKFEEMKAKGKNGKVSVVGPPPEPPAINVLQPVVLVQTIQELLTVATARGDTDLVIILKKQIHRAKLGDLRAAEFILNRAFGMPNQVVENKGDMSKPLVITIVNTNTNASLTSTNRQSERNGKDHH